MFCVCLNEQSLWWHGKCARSRKEKPATIYANLPEGASEELSCSISILLMGAPKGCGDQYVRDYFRIYQLPTVVFRQSCIYGLRQFGVEDQGWVAWFVIAAITGRPISIYGDGKQVRDILYSSRIFWMDMMLLLLNLPKIGGQVFNIGGGRSRIRSPSGLSLNRSSKNYLDRKIVDRYAW